MRKTKNGISDLIFNKKRKRKKREQFVDWCKKQKLGHCLYSKEGRLIKSTK